MFIVALFIITKMENSQICNTKLWLNKFYLFYEYYVFIKIILCKFSPNMIYYPFSSLKKGGDYKMVWMVGSYFIKYIHFLQMSVCQILNWLPLFSWSVDCFYVLCALNVIFQNFLQQSTLFLEKKMCYKKYVNIIFKIWEIFMYEKRKS